MTKLHTSTHEVEDAALHALSSVKGQRNGRFEKNATKATHAWTWLLLKAIQAAGRGAAEGQETEEARADEENERQSMYFFALQKG